MNKKLFKELKKSLKQAGRIAKGKEKGKKTIVVRRPDDFLNDGWRN